MIFKTIKHYIHRSFSYIKNISNAKNTQKLLSALQKNRKEEFNPFPQQGKIYWRASQNFYTCFYTYFNSCTLTKNIKKADYIFRWGMSKVYKILPFINKTKIYLMEDGFLRSITTNSDKHTPDIMRTPVGFVIDDLAPHFCMKYPSRLEQYIKNIHLSHEQINYSKQLINDILNHKLTKYNHQPCYIPNILQTNQHKVLIIDQSFGDFSVVLGGNGKRKDFEKMLNDALHDNPNSIIFIKVHPDTLAKGSFSKSYFTQKNTNHPRVILFAENVNPVCVIQAVDKVYVWSSGMGFEAILANKEVITYGTPFYAGWGLTTDRHPAFETEDFKKRRHEQRTKEELFYAAYIWYTHYINPDTCQKCCIEDAIKWLKDNKEKYTLNHKD